MWEMGCQTGNGKRNQNKTMSEDKPRHRTRFSTAIHMFPVSFCFSRLEPLLFALWKQKQQLGPRQQSRSCLKPFSCLASCSSRSVFSPFSVCRIPAWMRHIPDEKNPTRHADPQLSCPCFVENQLLSSDTSHLMVSHVICLSSYSISQDFDLKSFRSNLMIFYL